MEICGGSEVAMTVTMTAATEGKINDYNSHIKLELEWGLWLDLE